MQRSVILIASIFIFIFSLHVSAYTFVARHYIYSDAPSPTSCETIDPHWIGDNVWAGPQEVCTYENRPEGTKYLRDFWACTSFNSYGVCKVWEIKQGQWLNPPAKEE